MIITSSHVFSLCLTPLLLNSSFLPAMCILNHKATKTELLPHRSVIFLIFNLFAGSVNFLIADGLKFSHPLHHLGKGPEVNSDCKNSIGDDDGDHHRLILPLLPMRSLTVIN